MLEIILNYWMSGGWTMIAIAILAIWGYALAIQKDNWMSNIVVGLLGTVLGMMQTFSALSQGGASSIENLSKGISKALITTQTGISIAVVGVIVATMRKNK
jgi:drug/metabolite transporter (DMT)-like permease